MTIQSRTLPGTTLIDNLKVGTLSYPSVDGTSGQAIVTNGSGTLSFGVVGGGSGTTVFLQRQGTIVNTILTGTVQIPFDNTIPQNTEGNEFLTITIIPKSATSQLYIECDIQLSSNATQNTTVSLFKSGTANALTSVFDVQNGPGTSNFAHRQRLVYKLASGGTTSQTFTIRAGLASAGTLTFNGIGGSARLGGNLSSSLVISEIEE